ncbi:MAG: ferric-dicitrate binding protein FerR (iron transport regulator) [Myxococcota bacterium]|jgi:ferric-dicitrate binding protein FerR (iron transport regulator)
MSLHHTLSRLLSGDLSASEEADIRRRIDAEPAVAAAWGAMRGMGEDLSMLADIPPPGGLNASLSRAPRRWTPLLGGLAIAALALISLRPVLAPQPPPQVVIIEGRQWIEGSVLLLAGGHRIEVDGKVEVTVEPPVGGVRETGHPTPEAPMNTAAVLSALAGSAVTIAVYEGTALLHPATASTAPIALTAGETHTTVAPTVSSRAPEHQRAEAAATITRLESELEAARQSQDMMALENVINRGQLKAVQGEYADWPGEVPEVFTEAFLTEALTEQLADLESAELVRTDCDEYPCMVVIRSTDDSLAWGDGLQAHLAPLMESYDGEQTSVSVNRSAFIHDGYESRFMIIATSESSSTTDAIKARLDYRMGELVNELGEQVAEEAEEDGQ